MRGTFASRVLPAVLVVLVLALAAGLTTLKHPLAMAAGASATSPTSADVNTVIRACPAPGLAGSPDARVAIIAAAGGSAGSGKAVVGKLGTGATTPLLTLSQPGTLTVAPDKAPPPPKHSATPSPSHSGQPVATLPAPGGVVVTATGSMARGLEAEQVTSNGNATTRCDSPGTDFWFVGPGKFSVDDIRLYLMNPGDQAADVNVEALTDAGPLQGSTDAGVTVAPHSMVVQSLDTLLKGSRVIALHIRTSVGQVTAALHETTTKRGIGTWLPVAETPGTRLVLPGLPVSAGARTLLVAVPGTQDAHITLTAVTDRGSYEPTGGGGLDIPGGSAVSISLPSLGKVPAALKLTSNVPVTASALLPGGQPGSPGVFTVAYPPIAEQGVVAMSESGGGKASELLLSAPDQAVRAKIVQVAVGASGSSAATGPGETVQVSAKHTLVVPLKRPPGSPKGTAYSLIITPLPGSGPLYAGRVLAGSRSGGTVQSIVPVPSAITIVPLPTVRSAPITPAP